MPRNDIINFVFRVILLLGWLANMLEGGQLALWRNVRRLLSNKENSAGTGQQWRKELDEFV